MTEKEKSIIDEFHSRDISQEMFYEKFPINIRADKQYVIQKINSAIERQNNEDLDYALTLMYLVEDGMYFIDVMNNLLLEPNHCKHQEITRFLQDMKHPSSIEFIRKVLLTNYDYLEYTGSESRAISGWFSHALYQIGTKEAIDVIKEFSHSEDEGIREEMIYRLNKLEKN